MTPLIFGLLLGLVVWVMLPHPWDNVALAVVALVFVLALVTLTVIVLVLGISPHPWCRWPW